MIPSLTYFQLLLEFGRGVYRPPHFLVLGWILYLVSVVSVLVSVHVILGRMLERSSCGASFGNVKISDLHFAGDAVFFVETLDILFGALNVLNEESEPMEF